MGRPTYEAPTREYTHTNTHKHKQTHNLARQSTVRTHAVARRVYMCRIRIQSHGPSKCISALGSWPKSGCNNVAETVPALSGCGNARNRAEECRSALANARVGHQPASQKPSGGATVRAPAAACTRAPSRPNARTRDDARPPHLRRAKSPASSHTPLSFLGVVDRYQQRL
jgi:hypothetical protein